MIAAEEYGRALFMLAQEAGEAGPSDYLCTLEQVDALLQTKPEYLKLLDTPAVPIDERLGLIDEAFGVCEKNIINFFKILCEKYAFCHLHDCVKAYQKMYREVYAVAEVTCTTAQPLTEHQKETLYDKLFSMTGKEIILTCHVDPSLVGGMVLVIDGKQLDGSVKARLDTFRRNLAEIIV